MSLCSRQALTLNTPTLDPILSIRASGPLEFTHEGNGVGSLRCLGFRGSFDIEDFFYGAALKGVLWLVASKKVVEVKP